MISRSLLLALVVFGVGQVVKAPPPPSKVCDTRKTTTGDCCVFPFTYRNETFYDCTTKNLGVEWCATTADYDSNSNKWGKCDAPPKPIFDVILETNKNESKARFAAGVQLFQGDIVVDDGIRKFLNSRPGSGRSKRAVMRNERARWIINGKGVVPYWIESSNNNAKGVILRAMKHWMAKVPCLKFVPYKSGLGRYLSFFSGGGCYSMVGRQSTSGAQKISIGRGCEHLGVVAHEIGHALGFWHEQSRPDRDSYVTINWQNIQQGVAYNFDKYNTNKINSRGVSYDYNSIMHYSSTAFAKRRGVYTIVGKDGRKNLGQRYGLSDKDVQQANKLYCGSNPRPPTPPPTGPPTRPAVCNTRRTTNGDCCVFPFKYGSELFYDCTTKNNKGVEWCATTSDYNTNSKKWGKCVKKTVVCRYQDNHRWCPYWKSKGYCTHATHSKFMKKSCQKSCNCGKGSSSCSDKLAGCPGWKKRGFCNSQSQYGAYTRVYCKKSCNTCT